MRENRSHLFLLTALLFSVGGLLAVYAGSPTAGDVDVAFSRAAPSSHVNLGTDVLLKLERWSENCCFTDVALAMSADLNTGVAIVTTATYVNDAVFYQVDGMTDDPEPTVSVDDQEGFAAFTATTHDITADSAAVQEAVYLLSFGTSGQATVTMGTVADGAGNAVIPLTPAGETPVGYVRVAVDAGSTDFNATTDALDASHLTVTYVDLHVNPADSELE